LFCTPEYAFGVPGSLKNSLDWVVSSGELTYKPVAVITAATGGEKAHASLLYTLTAISASIVENGKLLISFIRAKMNEKNEVKDPATLEDIRKVVEALIEGIRNHK
jgi:NAD(P)H-dependent FMN reductase